MVQPNSRSGTSTENPRFVTDDLYASPGDDRSNDEFNEFVRGDIFRGRRVEPAVERIRREKRDDEQVRKAMKMTFNRTTPAGTSNVGGLQSPPHDTGKAEREAKVADDAAKAAEKKADAAKAEKEKTAEPKKTDEEKANEKVRKAQEAAPKGLCQFCHAVSDGNTCAEHKLPEIEG